MIGTITIGIIYRGRQEDATDYFMAGGAMRSVFQSLLVGLSIAATLFSGISFLSYPSVAYSSGAIILLALICFPVSWFVLRYWFLPRFLGSGTKYPYDVIENRLGPGVRTSASVMYVLLRIGWMAALIYVPTIAVMAAAGLAPGWFWPLVLIIGLCSTFYTVFGGIRGVIITDAMQFVIIAVGIIITVVYILFNIPARGSEIFTRIKESGALKVDFSLSLKAITFWALLIGYNVSTLAMYLADQMSLQRYMASGEMKAACRSFAFNITGAMVVVILLVTVGMSLSVWYHFVPDPKLPSEVDKIFPYFISTRLPVGVSGLLLAAILAATVSSMTSGINTLAATVTLDFRMRFGDEMTARQQLFFARVVSLVIGLCATVIAGFVGKLGTIFEITQTILGLFLGPLLTCIIFSVTSIRVNRAFLSVGMAAGVVAGAIAVIGLEWTGLWAAPVAFGVSMIVTLVGTCIFGSDGPVENSNE